MTTLSASYERIADTPKGPIVTVVFGGTYPPGSGGNEFGLQMVGFLRSALAETNAAAVVLDLLALDYIWGDAIVGLALPFVQENTGFRPAAIVATGRTAAALQPLLQPPFALDLAAMRLFDNRGAAIAHLERTLALWQCFVKWGELEQLLRRLARIDLRKPKHERGAVLSIVDGLVSKGVLTGTFRSRLYSVATTRDELVEGRSVPTETPVKPIVDDLDECLSIVSRLLSRAGHRNAG